MKRFLENLPVAVTLAEAGLWDDAREVVAEIEDLRRSRRNKILLVSGGESLPRDVLGYAVDLSRRMESDLVVLMREPKDKGAAEVARRELNEAAGDTAERSGIVCLMTQEELSVVAQKILRLVRRVEVALLHEVEDKTPYRRLRVPLYSASI